jgi:putative nucleotidyltransferase with HDIG domain
MTIQSLAQSTRYTHSQQVSRISKVLARYAGFTAHEVEVIEQAALLHDLGKCEIPDHILNKPGALTDAEFEVIKTHTRIGRERLTEFLQVLAAAAVIASQHHERMDGCGYMGIPGMEIHPYARLVAVADVYDALISRRAYKDAWSQEKVLHYMSSQSGSHFDMKYVSMLLEHVDEVMALYD